MTRPGASGDQYDNDDDEPERSRFRLSDSPGAVRFRERLQEVGRERRQEQNDNQHITRAELREAIQNLVTDDQVRTGRDRDSRENATNFRLLRERVGHLERGLARAVETLESLRQLPEQVRAQARQRELDYDALESRIIFLEEGSNLTNVCAIRGREQIDAHIQRLQREVQRLQTEQRAQQQDSVASLLRSDLTTMQQEIDDLTAQLEAVQARQEEGAGDRPQGLQWPAPDPRASSPVSMVRTPVKQEPNSEEDDWLSNFPPEYTRRDSILSNVPGAVTDPSTPPPSTSTQAKPTTPWRPGMSRGSIIVTRNEAGMLFA